MSSSLSPSTPPPSTPAGLSSSGDSHPSSAASRLSSSSRYSDHTHTRCGTPTNRQHRTACFHRTAHGGISSSLQLRVHTQGVWRPLLSQEPRQGRRTFDFRRRQAIQALVTHLRFCGRSEGGRREREEEAEEEQVPLVNFGGR